MGKRKGRPINAGRPSLTRYDALLGLEAQSSVAVVVLVVIGSMIALVAIIEPITIAVVTGPVVAAVAVAIAGLALDAILEAANPATRFERPNFILVGAVDSSGALADYSNKGSEVAIYANGDRVPARLPGGMQSFPTGTSMATPNVANAAAKMLTVNPALTGAEIKQLILQTADTNGTGQRLLHTRNAVEAARQTAGGH